MKPYSKQTYECLILPPKNKRLTYTLELNSSYTDPLNIKNFREKDHL